MSNLLALPIELLYPIIESIDDQATLIALARRAASYNLWQMHNFSKVYTYAMTHTWGVSREH